MKRRPIHRYSSDRPITKEPDDQLGRTSFAQRLAGDIIAWDGKDSLILGLYGDWGSGKTSLKNLVLSTLRKRRSKTPVLEFNPWQLSGTGGVSTGFFNEFRILLGSKKAEPNEAAVKASERLKKYSKRLSFGGTLGKVFGSLLAALGRPAEGAALLAAAEGIQQAAGVAEAGSEVSDASNNEISELSLTELKHAFEDVLRTLKRPVLVVLDDIDRLSTDEIREVFQLVKANADFPKVVYLLLFERSIVAKALDGVSNSRGSEFLEKIIQVGYHVPHASREAVQKVLFRGLDEHLAIPGVSRRWNKDRWSNLYLDGLAPYFRNLRHVYRFLSSFDFHVRQFRTGEHFEVNPIDLLGLETLRVFEPNVFERLAVAKRILTRDAGVGLFSKIEQDVVDTAISDLLTYASTGRTEQVRHILQNLFPPTSKTYEEGTGVSSNDWLRDARVCHPDLFDRYLTLSIKEDELAQSELDRLVDSAGDAAQFAEHLRRLQKRGLLKAAFDHLEAHKDHIPIENLPSLIQALSDVSDIFPEKEPGMFEPEMRMTAARVIYFGLRQEKSEQRRGEILVNAFDRSIGTLLPVFITSLQERRKEPSQDAHEYLVSETEWVALRDLSLIKIKRIADNGQLIRHSHAPMLLWRWSDWALDEAKAWVAEQISTKEGALWLLSTLLGEVHSHGRELEIRYYMKLSNIERFAEIDTIKVRLADADLSQASERERIAVKEFYRALKRRDAGKPEGDRWDRGLDGDNDEEN